jgi:hypothetical protein
MIPLSKTLGIGVVMNIDDSKLSERPEEALDAVLQATGDLESHDAVDPRLRSPRRTTTLIATASWREALDLLAGDAAGFARPDVQHRGFVAIETAEQPVEAANAARAGAPRGAFGNASGKRTA